MKLTQNNMVTSAVRAKAACRVEQCSAGNTNTMNVDNDLSLRQANSITMGNSGAYYSARPYEPLPTSLSLGSARVRHPRQNRFMLKSVLPSRANLLRTTLSQPGLTNCSTNSIVRTRSGSILHLAQRNARQFVQGLLSASQDIYATQKILH